MSRKPESIENRILSIRNQVSGIKTHQPTGTSNTRAYEIITNNQWDIEYTLPEAFPGAGGGAEYIVVKFIANHQVGPFATLSAIATIDGAPYNMISRNSFPISDEYITITDEIFGANEPGMYTWRVQISSPNVGSVFRLKFRVWATDRGYLEYEVQDNA